MRSTQWLCWLWLLVPMAVSCGGRVESDGAPAAADELPAEPEPGGVVKGVESTFAVGGAHTCAIKAGTPGLVRCVGAGDSGQLGNGETSGSRVAVDVGGTLEGPKQLVAGLGHTCARLGNGTVRCWGSNEGGQLGDGTNKSRSLPVRVRSLVNVVEVAAGAYHDCVRLVDGGVRCWGLNTVGQLGDGTNDSRNTPVKVTLDADATALAAGYTHSCAVVTDGSVFCWGANDRGQLGDGTTERRTKPVKVVGLGGKVVALASGEDHSCAVLADGRLQCWGRNFDGQLGDGTDELRSTPVFAAVTKVIGVALGRTHTCALREDRSVVCWGASKFSQIGVPTAGSKRPVPIASDGMTAIRSIGDHTCGATSLGVACWGRGAGGRLGDGTEIDRGVPALAKL